MEDFQKRLLRFAWEITFLLIVYAGLTVFLQYFYLGISGFPDFALPIKEIKHFFTDNTIKYSYVTALFISTFATLSNPFKKLLSDYGGAHWAAEWEIKKMGMRDKRGLILAYKGGKYIRTNEPLSVLCYAPPGVGKTSAIIIPSLLSCGNSAIVHDPKGELLRITGPHRSKYSKIIQFAPGESISAKWNPLSKRELPQEWADIQVHVDRVANSLIATSKGNDTDEYWTREARSIFIFWALYLIHVSGETSLPDVLERAFSSGDPQKDIAEAMEAVENLPRRITLEGNALLAKADREFAGVIGTFKSKMAVFLDERVAGNLRDSDFTFNDLRKERTTIYLSIKNSDQTRLASVIGLFFELAVMTYISEAPKEEEKSITLYLDEFVRISKMQEVIELPAISRSYRVNAIFVCQSFQQLVGRYGKEGAEQLISSCAYHVYFTQNERPVAEDISKKIGNKTRSRRSYSKTPGQRGSESQSHEGVPLVLPQEILSLKMGDMIICVQSSFEAPIRCKAAFWYKDKTMLPLVIDSPGNEFIHIPGNGSIEIENPPEAVNQEPEEVKPFEAITAAEEPPEEKKREVKKRSAVCEICGRETTWKEQFEKTCLNPDPETFELCQGIMREVEISTPTAKKRKQVALCDVCGRKTTLIEEFNEDCLKPDSETGAMCQGVMREAESQKGVGMEI